MTEVQIKALFYFGVTSLGGWLLLFLGISRIGSMRERRWRESYETTGWIVDFDETEIKSGRGGTRIIRTPVLEFSVYDKSYRLKYGVVVDHKKFRVGQAVGILYDLNDPTHFHMKEDESFYHGNRNAILYGTIWILLCMIITLLLVTLVGGYSLAELFSV